jgi:hypothetical protein
MQQLGFKIETNIASIREKFDQLFEHLKQIESLSDEINNFELTCTINGQSEDLGKDFSSTLEASNKLDFTISTLMLFGNKTREIFQNGQRLPKGDEQLIDMIEQDKIIEQASRKLNELGALVYYMPCHPTMDVEMYEKYMHYFLTEDQKQKYQEWKKEFPEMINSEKFYE